MIYFTADIHFYHENIINHTKRPFKNADEMNRKIIDNWNNIVKANDEVYILGDVTMKGASNANTVLSQLKEKIFYINKQKLNPFTAHCFIYAGQETTTPSYRKWQKIRNGYDDILRLFNSDTYKNFFNNKKEEKKESGKNEK